MMYEVMVPIIGHMKVYINARNKKEAEKRGKEIAIEMSKDASDTIIPNLFDWNVDVNKEAIVIERGEIDG